MVYHYCVTNIGLPVMRSLAEEFDFRVLTEDNFKNLVTEFCLLIKDSEITGAELFWRKVQSLTGKYSESDIDDCQFALLMAGHYSIYAERGFELYKSQETLVLGENYTIDKFLGE
jgi:hypothetical protein